MTADAAAAWPAPPALATELATFAAGRAVLARTDVALQELAGGAENRVWRLQATDLDWVVRAAGARDARLGVDRRRELAAARLAAAHGFAPPIVHASPERGLLVTGHVAGSTWSRDVARSSTGIARFAARVRTLHAVPVGADLPPVDPAAAIRSYLALPAPPGAPLDRACLDALARSALVRLAPRPRALCHHDLHHRNVIDADALVFVDWEYAGRGEPLLDLAAFAAYHDLDAARRVALLDAYASTGAPSAAPPPGAAPLVTAPTSRPDAAHFAAALLLFDCLQALWYDAADAWSTLGDESRDALVERLARAFSPRR